MPIEESRGLHLEQDDCQPGMRLMEIRPKLAGDERNGKSIIGLTKDETAVVLGNGNGMDAVVGGINGGSADPMAISDTSSDSNLRKKWSRSIEFLLSCVALSVGFGNVWRFPYTAFENGGGAFVIPYLVVLLVVGRPLYYLEMVLGQFASRGCVKVYDMCPLLRGIGVGQTLAMLSILGYYAAILSLAVRYFIDSFKYPLPWGECQPEWTEPCVQSSFIALAANSNATPSAALYFNKNIMHSRSTLDDGLGTPDVQQVLCLLACWIIITGMMVKGIRSSGKAAYFLAIFPYVILIILLINAINLDGASDGILYFFKPQFDKILTGKVWYEAVSQCFFSLTIGLGAVIVFSSFNGFSNNIYRDALIISWLDTFTSMLSGVIVFGVVGNVAKVTNQTVDSVMKGGPELTFITYPDAIAKMPWAPNAFAVLFFLMFILLGLGSNTGIVMTILTSLQDRFPQISTWKAVIGIGIVGFTTGLAYITPAGLILLDIVDFYAVRFVCLTLIILEIVAVCWVYGVNRICFDIKFMLGKETGIFWRVCWGFLTVALIIPVLGIFLIDFDVSDSPFGYKVFGWCLYLFTVLQVVGWAIYAVQQVKKNKEMALVPTELSLWRRIVIASRPTQDWGPEGETTRSDYQSEYRRYMDSIGRSGGVATRAFRRIFK